LAVVVVTSMFVSVIGWCLFCTPEWMTASCPAVVPLGATPTNRWHIGYTGDPCRRNSMTEKYSRVSRSGLTRKYLCDEDRDL